MADRLPPPCQSLSHFVRAHFRRHMKTAAQLGTIGVTAIFAAAIHPTAAIPLVWIGVDFAAFGYAHHSANPHIFGKAQSGRLSAIRTAAFLPLLLYTWGVWHLIRLLSREPACNSVTEDIEIGRRLITRELKRDYCNYVDLTAEFPEPGAAVRPGYISLPVLDAATPSRDALRAAIAALRPGLTFIHCAQGHGRTGLFAAALLMHRGLAKNADDAVSLIQKARPAVRLNKKQMDFLRSLETEF